VVTQVVRVSFTVEANYAGWRLDRYLKEKIRRLSRERIQRLIAQRLESEEGRRLKPSTRVRPGLTFVLLKDQEPEPETPLVFGVVHDDGALLVVDKPAGLPVHPTARYAAHTFTALAKLRFPDRKVDPAHRLDRETSGLLACGSAPEWTKLLKRDFAKGRVAKTYLALVEGAPAADRFEVDAPIGLTGASTVRVRMHVDPAGLPSRTEFQVLGRRTAPDGAAITLLACHPRTGRQHQIRAHLHHAGLPLVGDKIYGPDEAIFDRFTRHEMTDADRERLRLSRHALHAWRLELPHPRTREPVTLEAPLPEELAGFWAGCREAPVKVSAKAKANAKANANAKAKAKAKVPAVRPELVEGRSAGAARGSTGSPRTARTAEPKRPRTAEPKAKVPAVRPELVEGRSAGAARGSTGSPRTARPAGAARGSTGSPRTARTAEPKRAKVPVTAPPASPRRRTA
jgi:23S rRNA pseudouridine1911/1915/1917 synthase